MKKYLGLIFAFMLSVFSVGISLGQPVSASAQVIDDADEYFIEFVLSDSTYEGNLVYSHSPLYNAQLQSHGREYTFIARCGRLWI